MHEETNWELASEEPVSFYTPSLRNKLVSVAFPLALYAFVGLATML